MRLGINTLFLVPGDVGGTETYLRETLLAAARAFPEVDFILFTNRENDSLFQVLLGGSMNVRTVCLHFKAAIRPLRILLEQSLLPLLVKMNSIDLLWSPGYTAPLFNVCPQVVTVCDLQYKRFPEDLSRLERAVLDFLVRGACRRCDAVLAISEFSRSELVAFHFAGREKTYSHLLGVDPSFGASIAEEEKEECLQQLSLSRPFILCVAHSYPHKKLEVLVNAFVEVEDRIPHRLVVVGRPRRGEHLIELALASLKDRNRYRRFDRGLPYRTLQILFRSADLFVLPSAYEGFGLPVIEAMMAEVPVVTTAAGALREVAGGHAFIADRVDAQSIAEQILKVCSLTKDDRRSLIDAAKQWAQTFTWERTAREMFRVFEEVLDAKG